MNSAQLIEAYGVSSNTDLDNFASRIGLQIKEINFAESINITGDGAYVINLGEQGHATHWTGLWIEHGKAFYFDSYGVGPETILLDKVEPYATEVMYNDNYEFQRYEEELCGMWVLMFFWYMKKCTGSLNSRFKKMTDRYLDTL